MDRLEDNFAGNDMDEVPQNLYNEEQSNPYSDVVAQYNREPGNPYREDPGNQYDEGSGNTYDEAQANLFSEPEGQYNEEPANPYQEVPENTYNGEVKQQDSLQVEADKRWPGWPGDSVFRILVPAQKVGAIIGRKGEFVKRMCEESKARIKILDGPPGVPERAVATAV